MKNSKLAFLAAVLPVVAVGPTVAQKPHAPTQRITLNNRVFLATADVYDPAYGLLRIGVIKDNVLTFLPLNKQIRNFPMPAPQ